MGRGMVTDEQIQRAFDIAYRHARKRRLPEEAAEDIGQIVSISAWRGFNLPVALFEPWVITTAKHKVNDWLRSHYRQSDREEPTELTEIEERIPRAEQRITDAIFLDYSRLHDEDYRLVALVQEGYTYREMAQRLGCSVGQLQRRLRTLANTL